MKMMEASIFDFKDDDREVYSLGVDWWWFLISPLDAN